ncbi:MAG: hypothetical protein ACSHYA_17015 [Opitutaceae bacterium]
MKIHFVALLVLAGLLTGCSTVPEPSPNDSSYFSEGPVIIKRGESYFLRIRRDLRRDSSPLVMPISFKRNENNGRAYYYLYGPVSFAESGQVYERPLSLDTAQADARSGNVYWLSGDGTELKIPVVVEGKSQTYEENPWIE